MAEITDEQVTKKQAAVEALADKVEQAKRELMVSEAGRHNHVTMASLSSEEDRLKAELAQLNDQLKASKEDPSKDQVVQQISGSVADAISREEIEADKATKEK